MLWDDDIYREYLLSLNEFFMSCTKQNTLSSSRVREEELMSLRLNSPLTNDVYFDTTDRSTFTTLTIVTNKSKSRKGRKKEVIVKINLGNISINGLKQHFSIIPAVKMISKSPVHGSYNLQICAFINTTIILP